ncbi:MAG TPA: tetratricopeptide repeat protein [Gemmatimonadales bacterium]|nr:tetratricopeptide repeat protein [Gemmatimonadales bacterium]
MNARNALLACLTVFATARMAAQQAASLGDLEARVRADSNDPLALYYLAQAYADSGRTEGAQHLLETVVKIDGEFAAAYALLGRLEIFRSGPNGAFLARAADLYPELLGDSSRDSATLLFRRSAQLDPMQELDPPAAFEEAASWRSPYWGALQEFWHRRFERAAAKLGEAIAKADHKHKPPSLGVLWYHALAEYDLQHLDSSAVDLERLLRALQGDSSAVPGNTSQRVRYALAYVDQQAGHAQSAESLYQEVIERDLSLDLAHMQLARLYENAARWSEAIRERRAALEIAPENSSFLYDLGVTLLEAGQLSEAADILRDVILRCPRNTRSYYALGLTLERLQQPQASRDAYDLFLKLAPSRYADMIADAKERLAHLPP